MKKKQIANLIMVAVILLIAAAGVLSVGHIRGWFDAKDNSCAVLSQIRGIVNIEREGVSYPAEEGTALRAGDKLRCNPGTTAAIRTADGSLVLANSAQLQIINAAADDFAADISTGEVFIHVGAAASFTFEGNTVEVGNAAALLSVRAGAQTVSVFSGAVGEAQAGQTLDWVNGQMRVGKLAIESLDEFAIAQLRDANKTAVMCFTDEELGKLEADRWAERQAQLQDTESTEPEETDAPTDAAGDAADQIPDTTAPEKEPDQSTQKPTETTKPSETTVPPETAEKLTCTISIRCDTILNNRDDLDPAKAGYVPSSGCILPAVTVEIEEGETVFEILKRVCTTYGIQIEYSWTPMNNSYYIEGINHLYEFDCGPESGWMYQVNGWFPNYGCSSYTLTGGENIVWCYTCKGLGADVGAPAVG